MTLKVSGTALLVAGLVGLPSGIHLGLNEFKGKAIVRLLVYTGMGLPPVFVGLIVFLLLSNNGVLGGLEWLFTPSGMVLAQSILATPLIIGLTAASLAEVPQNLVLQLRSLGATPLQERLTIFLQARNGVIAAIAAALGRVVSEVGAVMLVGGNIAGRTRVLSTAIVLETHQGNFEFALVLGVILVVIALLANFIVLRLTGRWAG